MKLYFESANTSLINNIRNYLSMCGDLEELFDNYSIRTLTFGYLMGMYPNECEGIDVESEFSDDQLDEYDRVYDAMYQIRRSL